MRQLYLAIAVLTLASRAFTLASNVSREYRYYKHRKRYELEQFNKFTKQPRKNRFHTEDAEFYEETEDDHWNRF